MLAAFKRGALHENRTGPTGTIGVSGVCNSTWFPVCPGVPSERERKTPFWHGPGGLKLGRGGDGRRYWRPLQSQLAVMSGKFTRYSIYTHFLGNAGLGQIPRRRKAVVPLVCSSSAGCGIACFTNFVRALLARYLSVGPPGIQRRPLVFPPFWFGLWSPGGRLAGHQNEGWPWEQ